MGIFGRKTFKLGPFRMTASQSGLSSSIGGKRVRARVGGSGRKSLSVRLAKGLRWTRSSR